MMHHSEGIARWIKTQIRELLAKLGWRLVRISDEEMLYRVGGFDRSIPLPQHAEIYLNHHNPRLHELRERYAKTQLPMTVHTLWNEKYLRTDLDLRYFRGDNAYVWQFRNIGEHARLKYYLFAEYVAARDARGLLHHLGEDGQFGCWTFRYEGWPVVSRDLLDSINEIYFLDRHWSLFDRPDSSVLDIGAGYGRLAYRMLRCVPALKSYYCVDAVPESTFLCEFYLGYRNCLDRAVVVPLDELTPTLGKARIDLAVNVHSFSEMSYAVVEGWLRLLKELRVNHLFIVSDDEQQLLSVEADKSRRDCLPLLEATGFRLKASEPVFSDASVRDLVGVRDYFLLFERNGAMQ